MCIRDRTTGVVMRATTIAVTKAAATQPMACKSVFIGKPCSFLDGKGRVPPQRATKPTFL